MHCVRQAESSFTSFLKNTGGWRWAVSTDRCLFLSEYRKQPITPIIEKCNPKQVAGIGVVPPSIFNVVFESSLQYSNANGGAGRV